jgi:hypothetical protein
MKFGKYLLNSLLATSLVMSYAGAVWANEHEPEATVQTAEVVMTTTSVVEAGSTSTAETNQVTTAVSTEQPALLPGDFFYFLKVVTEKIQLALTFNDTQKAKLMAEFALDRLAEAEALYTQGKTLEAEQTLQIALAQQELAVQSYVTVETEQTTTQSTEESTESAETTTEATVEATTEATNSIEAELEAKFTANIAALTVALEKVNNPQAKASLEKNIIKAQAKLEKKINKAIEKAQKKSTSEVDVETKVETEIETEVEVESAVKPVSVPQTEKSNRNKERNAVSVKVGNVEVQTSLNTGIGLKLGHNKEKGKEN